MFLIKSAVVVSGVVAGLMGFSPAHAVTSPTADVSTSETCISFRDAAKGCFDPNGDHIKVYDLSADGLRPSVQWRTSYGRRGECWWTGKRPHDDCNYNMREDATIEFRLYLHGSPFYITGWKRAGI